MQPQLNNKDRNDLIIKYLPYIKNIANQFGNKPSIESEELVNIAVIGVIKALDKYDKSRGIKLMSYVYHKIRSEVLEECRSRDFLSRNMRAKTRKLEREKQNIESKNLDDGDHEIAKSIGVSVEKLCQIGHTLNLKFVNIDKISHEIPYNYSIVNDVIKKETILSIKKIIDGLPEKWRFVMRKYYESGMTMKHIGKILGVSESRVSQIHTEAVRCLREKLREK